VAFRPVLVSFVRCNAPRPVFIPMAVATALVHLPHCALEGGATNAFYDELIARLEGRRWCSARRCDRRAADRISTRRTYAVVGRPLPPAPERPLASLYLVTEHYFSTMQIPLRAGAASPSRDDASGPEEMRHQRVVREAALPGESAIGKLILRGGPPNDNEQCEIIASPPT